MNVEDLDKSVLDIKTPKIKNFVISLRNKAIRKNGDLEKFLNKYDKSKFDMLGVISKINESISNVNVPYSVIRQNPTIDSILQDELYTKVLNDGIEKWVIHPNSNFYKKGDREHWSNFGYKEKSFFWQLDSIIIRLDEIFKITYEIYKKDNFSITTTGICINTVNWLEGKSIGELISSRINYYAFDKRVKPEKRIDPNNIEHINSKINEVIKINLKITTFSFLKYFKVLTAILDKILSDEEKEKYKMTLALPIYIELGTQEPIVIDLISNGIPRTIALKLFKLYKKTQDYKDEKDIFYWMKTMKDIKGLAPIYNKFLIKNNFLKVIES